MTVYSHRETLELICALGGEDYSKHGHAMSVRLARAALFGHPPALTEKDWQEIERNWPKGVPLRFIGATT